MRYPTFLVYLIAVCGIASCNSITTTQIQTMRMLWKRASYQKQASHETQYLLATKKEEKTPQLALLYKQYLDFWEKYADLVVSISTTIEAVQSKQGIETCEKEAPYIRRLSGELSRIVPLCKRISYNFKRLTPEITHNQSDYLWREIQYLSQTIDSRTTKPRFFYFTTHAKTNFQQKLPEINNRIIATCQASVAWDKKWTQLPNFAKIKQEAQVPCIGPIAKV